MYRPKHPVGRRSWPAMKSLALIRLIPRLEEIRAAPNMSVWRPDSLTREAPDHGRIDFATTVNTRPSTTRIRDDELCDSRTTASGRVQPANPIIGEGSDGGKCEVTCIHVRPRHDRRGGSLATTAALTSTGNQRFALNSIPHRATQTPPSRTLLMEHSSSHRSSMSCASPVISRLQSQRRACLVKGAARPRVLSHLVHEEDTGQDQQCQDGREDQHH
jgi:hypothetical protein